MTGTLTVEMPEVLTSRSATTILCNIADPERKARALNDSQTWYDQLPAELRDLTLREAPLCELTTLRIGGPVALLCSVPNPASALGFQSFAAERKLPCRVLGGGSNILAADIGFPGLLLQVTDTNLHRQGTTLTVGAGLGFDDLIAASLDAGLTGLEFASGVPGGLGGALAGNAGCYGHEIAEFVSSVLVLRRNGTLESIGNDDIGFSYRHTDLRDTGDLILQATLELVEGDRDRSRQTRAEHLADRRRKHPVDTPCAGSWFRNLPPAEPGGRRRAAGALLEAAGAKDMAEGDARVFAGHANMIINTGRAGSDDVLRLAQRMKSAVQSKFGVDLLEEVRYFGPERPSDD